MVGDGLAYYRRDLNIGRDRWTESKVEIVAIYRNQTAGRTSQHMAGNRLA